MSSSTPLKAMQPKQIRVGVFGRPTLPALAAAISMIQAAGARAVERAAIHSGPDQYEPFDAVVVQAASPIARSLREVYNDHGKPAFPVPSDPAQFHASPAANALANFLGLDILAPATTASEPGRTSGAVSDDPATAAPESAGVAVGDASEAVAPSDAPPAGALPPAMDDLRADLAAEGIALTEHRDGGMVEATLSATTPEGQDRLNAMAADALADGAVIDPATLGDGAAVVTPIVETEQAPAPKAGRGRRGRTSASAE